MTEITITLRQVFPQANEDDVCLRFDADVDADGVKWCLLNVAGIAAGFRQDMHPDLPPVPVFPSDYIGMPVTGTDFDEESARLELLCDSGWTALMQWHSANDGNVASGLPYTVTIQYPE